MDARKLRPAHGFHLGRRVELHGARAQRNHATVERVIFVGEVLEVAHHARLRAVRVEHRVREVLTRAVEVGGNAVVVGAIREASIQPKSLR